MLALAAFPAPRGAATGESGASYDELIVIGTTALPADPEGAFRAAMASRYDVARALDATLSEQPYGPTEDSRFWAPVVRNGIARHVVYAGRRYRMDDFTGQRGVLQECDKQAAFELDLRRHIVQRTFFYGEDVVRARGVLGGAVPSSRPARLSLVGEADRQSYHVALTLPPTKPGAAALRLATWDFTFADTLPAAACPVFDPILAVTGITGPLAAIAAYLERNHIPADLVDRHLAQMPSGSPATVTFAVGTEPVVTGVVVRLHENAADASDPRLEPPSEFRSADAQTRAAGVETVVATRSSRIDAVIGARDGSVWYTVRSDRAVFVRRIGRDGTDREVAFVDGDIGYGSAALAADGALWLVDNLPNALVRVSASGTVQRVALNRRDTVVRALAAVADGFLAIGNAGRACTLEHVGPDGAAREPVRNTGVCWRNFGTPLVASRAGRVVVPEADAHRLAILERDGTVRRIDVGDGYPTYAAFAPDETVWFVEPNRLGHVDAAGRITLQPISVELSNGAQTSGIAVASDGTVWILLGQQARKFDMATLVQHRPQLNDATLLHLRPHAAFEVFPFAAVSPAKLTLDARGEPLFVAEWKILRKSLP